METEANLDTIALSAEIVAAYVSNNPLRSSDLADLLVQVHGAIAKIEHPDAAAVVVEQSEKATPAQIRKSITPDALISFIDGKPYKTIKRHLTTHGLSVAEYRERYGLPADYPVVAASYSAMRAALAKDTGLGVRPTKAPEPVASKAKRAPRSRKAAELA